MIISGWGLSSWMYALMPPMADGLLLPQISQVTSTSLNFVPTTFPVPFFVCVCAWTHHFPWWLEIRKYGTLRLWKGPILSFGPHLFHLKICPSPLGQRRIAAKLPLLIHIWICKCMGMQTSLLAGWLQGNPHPLFRLFQPLNWFWINMIV